MLISGASAGFAARDISGFSNKPVRAKDIQ
jgi:hypothetical protein